jgi:hypothetical protein
MRADELEAIRSNLDLSQEAMANLLQCDYVGYKRYATGARPIPRYIKRSARVLEFVRVQGLQTKLIQFLTS